MSDMYSIWLKCEALPNSLRLQNSKQSNTIP